jgi:hypothetical protein
VRSDPLTPPVSLSLLEGETLQACHREPEAGRPPRVRRLGATGLACRIPQETGNSLGDSWPTAPPGRSSRVSKERCPQGLSVPRKSANVQEPTSHRDHSQYSGRLCFNHIHPPRRKLRLRSGLRLCCYHTTLWGATSIPKRGRCRKGHLASRRRRFFTHPQASAITRAGTGSAQWNRAR